MTLPTAPDPEQLAIELAAAQQVARGLKKRLRAAMRKITAAYVVYAGSIHNPLPERFRGAFAQEVSRIIAAVEADIRQPLWYAIWRGLMAGQRNALSYIDQPGRLEYYGHAAFHEAVAGIQDVRRVYGPEVAATIQWAADVVHAAQTRLDAALLSARAMRFQIPPNASYADVLAAMAPLNNTLQALDRDIRYAVNAGFNQAARDVAERHGVGRMWIAEVDACLTCLALSGEIAPPGKPFDSNLTFKIGPSGAPQPLPVYPAGPLWGPPRHPNCRCHTIPVPELADYPVMPWEAGPVHPSEALKREARRSVLRGDARSESMPARLRATAALLERGAGLPKSVEARARRAVARHRYERRPA